MQGTAAASRLTRTVQQMNASVSRRNPGQSLFVGTSVQLTPFMVAAVCTLEATASMRDAMRSQFRPSFFFRMAFSA